MEVWQIVLYGAAALIALKSFSTLMTGHRERLLREIAEREEEKRREAEARAKAERAAQKTGFRRTGAA
ncbi:MAG TPA: hypothetical protein VKU82_07935 [Planctomycetaceae bacterium]|nr:hypothetical protein [Planctomycetaceae bacterium]